MKLKTLTFVGLLSLMSCTNASSPIAVQALFPLGTCVAGEDTKDLLKAAGNGSVTSGYLDVAAGSPQYFAGVFITGEEKIVQPASTLPGSTLERPDRNRPVILQQSITYRLSKRVGATPKVYLSNRTMPFLKGVASGAIQLISPELGAQLFDGLTPSNAIDDFVDILVDIEFLGEYSNTQTPFTTGVYTFPIRAFRSAPPTVCPNGFVRFAAASATGQIDFCSYVGQSYEQTVAPLQPSTCCAPAGSPTTPGC